MHSYKYSVKLIIWVASFLFLCFNNLHVHAQCKITAPTTKLCRGNSVTFTTSTSASSYVWNSGDGKTENKQTATFLYDHYGVFTLKLILYNPDNTIKCRDSLTITVYDLPKANMQLGDSIETCFNQDYCFINTSSKSANNSPFAQYLWLFGDGDISGMKNPCHRYDNSGDYLIFLNVRDSNNCESKIEKKVHISVGTSMNPELKIISVDSCPVTKARFINITDTNGKHITKFIMDFGDGSKDTSSTKKNYSHTYTKDSAFVPKLTVINNMGCKETYYPNDDIVNTILNFNFNITASPQVSCWPDSLVIFYQPPLSKYDGLLWDFGDPMSGEYNLNGSSWNPRHAYLNPGMYDISLTVKSSYCQKDTTLCKFITIRGPRARINLPKVKNDCLNNRPLPKSKFIDASSLCLNPKGDSIAYIRRMKVPPYIRSTIDTYCFADTLSFILKKSKCRTDTIYTLKPSGTKKFYDTVSIFFDYWYPGDPFPTGNIYFPPSGSCNSQVMHDTDIYPLNCGAPNYVRFTNNSIKFRGTPAIDDKPPFISGSVGSDQCLNPAYPWASDSLQYFWDFGDYYAPKCTSTYSNNNILCRYSNQKVPWHLYKKDGCYKVYLTVYDPVTKCTSRDSVKIAMQKPDAGWDTSAYDYLNYRMQLYKPEHIPRRGLIMMGMECTGIPQGFSLSEVLPDCNVQDWGIVADSAADCFRICTDTSFIDINYDGNPDTVIHYKDSCRWLTKSYFSGTNMGPGYIYSKPGCKTLGLWIKSGDCYDTFWYHSYKYISQVDPSFYLYDQDSLKLFSIWNVCSPFKPAFSVALQNQECITGFSIEIKRYRSSKVLSKEYCKLVKDTILVLASKKNPSNKFFYPDCNCPDDPLNKLKLQDLLVNNIIVDTQYILSLKDTIFSKFTINDTGTYEIMSTITNTSGCSLSSSLYIGVGFTADFYAWDSFLCVNDTTSFFPDIRYYNSQNKKDYKVDFDYNDDGIYDSGSYYKYTRPGIYNVKMRVKDTLCNTVRVFTKKHYIFVGGVDADFDTLNSPSNCAPQVVGFADRSKLLTPYIYKYDSLGNKIDSSLYDQIVSWEWNFGDHKGSNSRSFKESPKHAYTANGEFDVSLLVITALGCIDSSLKEKYIKIDGPKPAFDLLDTVGCVPFTARFVDTSLKVSDWIWQLGDNSQVSGFYKSGDTVLLTYNIPGTFYPTLIGSDSVYNIYLKTYTRCTSIFPDPMNPEGKKYRVTVLPVNKLRFTGDTIICSGEEATFTDISDTSYKNIFWDFGDSSTQQTNCGEKVTHIYTLPGDDILGKYDIKIDGQGSRCPDFPNTKTVTVKRVIADIIWDSSMNTDPIFCFKNYSRGGTKYNWRFKDGSPYNIKTTDTNYRCTNYYLNKGVKTVCLIAENEIGCKDEDCEEIENNYDVLIKIPNIFTPGNNDLINDSFTIATKNIEVYNLTIYNRWGSVVFVSNDPKVHWNGIEMEKGKPCSAGTYYYVLDYKFKHLQPNRVSGTITLMR